MTDHGPSNRQLADEIVGGYRHGHTTADPQCIYPTRTIPGAQCAPCAWHRNAYPAKELTP